MNYTKQFVLALSLFTAASISAEEITTVDENTSIVAKEIAVTENVSHIKAKIANALTSVKNTAVNNVQYTKNGIVNGYQATTNAFSHAFSSTKNGLYGKIHAATTFTKNNPYKVGFVTVGIVAAALMYKIFNNNAEEETTTK